MTSYQKLKEENKNLKRDIYKILEQNDETIFFWTKKRDLEKLFMYGIPTNDDPRYGFNGLIPKLNEGQNIDKND